MAKPRVAGRVFGGPGGEQARKLVKLAKALGYRVDVRPDGVLLFPPNGKPMISLHLTQLRSGKGYRAFQSRIRRVAKGTIPPII